MNINIGAIITSVLMTVAGRLLSALGLSMMSYVGLNEMQGYFLKAISEQMSNIPEEALQIMYIAGFGVVLNWIFGAFIFVISVKSLKKLSTIIASK